MAAAIGLLAGLSNAGEPKAPVVDLAPLRLTALVQSPDGLRVGIVDPTQRREYWLAPGQTEDGLTLAGVNFGGEQATVRSGDAERVLRLRAGEEPPPETGTIAESTAQFLREFPDAVEKGLIRLPVIVPPPPAAGRGETIEAFLRKDPAARALADQPQTGLGSGIEGFLRQQPGAAKPAPIPLGQRGETIEKALQGTAPAEAGWKPPAAAEPEK